MWGNKPCVVTKNLCITTLPLFYGRDSAGPYRSGGGAIFPVETPMGALLVNMPPHAELRKTPVRIRS